MHFCGSTPDEKKKSKNHDKNIKKWMKTYKQVIKVLLLGAGESGKTTILKQMKILHIKGFSEEEKLEKRDQIRSNLLESIKTLVDQMKIMDIPLASNINEEFYHFIDNINPLQPYHYPEEFFIATSGLWKDQGIKRVFAERDRFQLLDCAEYFLDKTTEVADPNYVPSAQDILNCRHRTTDVHQIEFEIKIPKKGSVKFWMFDVGGQRGERKKWIQVFDVVNAVLFVVASSSYDVYSSEDNCTNALQESLDIFENVWSSRFLRHAGFILFLNKQDQLKEKVKQGKDIGLYFPNYRHYDLEDIDEKPGENIDYLKTRCFIRDMFIDVTQKLLPPPHLSIVKGMKITMDNEQPRDCYSHFIVATDTNNVRLVFEDVKNMILVMNLTEIGLL